MKRYKLQGTDSLIQKKFILPTIRKKVLVISIFLILLAFTSQMLFANVLSEKTLELEVIENETEKIKADITDLKLEIAQLNSYIRLESYALKNNLSFEPQRIYQDYEKD